MSRALINVFFYSKNNLLKENFRTTLHALRALLNGDFSSKSFTKANLFLETNTLGVQLVFFLIVKT